jgi:hypothetical protein
MTAFVAHLPLSPGCAAARVPALILTGKVAIGPVLGIAGFSIMRHLSCPSCHVDMLQNGGVSLWFQRLRRDAASRSALDLPPCVSYAFCIRSIIR